MKTDSIKRVSEWAQLYHRPEHKTAIQGNKPHLFAIVTKVNYLTAKLWLENIYNKVNGKNGFVNVPKDNPNWIVMSRKFRREKEIEIKTSLNEMNYNTIPHTTVRRKDVSIKFYDDKGKFLGERPEKTVF